MTLRREIELRAHSIEGQGDGIVMVLIRMDEIIAAVRKWKKDRKRENSRKRRRPRAPAVRHR